jgi:branched-chain amino acid transport system permease protein
VGTAFMILLPEILRFLRIPDSIAANMRQIIYGLLIIIILRFRPQGLKGEYRFQ